VLAADLVAALDQLVGQLHRFEIGPANVGFCRLPALCASRISAKASSSRLALDGLRASAAGSANALGVATGAAWRPAAVLAHRLQFPNPRVDPSPLMPKTRAI